MAQIFHPSMNTVAKATIFGAVFLLGGLGWVGYTVEKSPYNTDAGIPRNQPVPFSHEHHVRGLGIDCRYCHTSVEDSSFAGLPPTKTCMTCHSQIWSNTEMLRPVRQSWASNQPIQWSRVHNLPDFVYFNHSVHVNKGVGCSTCHGEVDRMPLMWQQASLQMAWCLDCHRAPEQFLRPRDQVFNMHWTAPSDQLEEGRKLVEKYGVKTGELTNCSICHR
jgi:Cytochrome c7 and related cytochrome c/Class III cytochrome C family